MKVKEVIDIVDKIIPNEFDYIDKLRWLNRVEKDVFETVVSRHLLEVSDTIIFNLLTKSFDEWTKEDSENVTLMVPFQYCELYIQFIVANIYLSREEVAKYNNAMRIYNSVMQQYRNWYASTHTNKKSAKITGYKGW